jgi:serine/threonine protein kinase
VFYVFVLHGRQKTHKSRNDLSSDATDVQSEYTTSNGYDIEMATSMFTAAPDNTALFVPGYCCLRNNVDFIIGNKLGKGGAATVYVGDALTEQLMRYGKHIVVKILADNRVAASGQNMSSAFDQEISIMEYIKGCPHLVEMLGYCEEPLSIIMKLYPLGSLKDWIKMKTVNTMSLKLQFMKDMSRGVSFMHRKGVAHCDLKPGNILIDSDEHDRPYCVLTDFGISILFTEKADLVHAFNVMNLHGASISYAAPEVMSRLRRRAVSSIAKDVCSADIYSLGIISADLLTQGLNWKD